MNIPRADIEPIILEAEKVAKQTGKTQFVRSINFDELYSSLGFSDDPELVIGTLHATVTSNETIRHFTPTVVRGEGEK